MALDGVLLNGVISEIQDKLNNGRVEKIHQPEKDEIHIMIRNRGENFRLMLSASANHSRLHLTETNKKNPLTPPMFCMVLRKHLTGGRVVSIHQPEFERIIEISFEVLNELGDHTYKKLIIEIMGRHSNIIFIDNNGKILDSIKHINDSISRVREVLPGKNYSYPPSQGKCNPLYATEESLISVFEQNDSSARLDRVIGNSFTGISKVTAEEILARCSLLHTNTLLHGVFDHKQLATSFLAFFYEVKEKRFQPTMLVDEEGMPRDIFPFPYCQYDAGLQQSYSSFSETLDAFYADRDMVDRKQQRTAHLSKVIKTNLERCEKKLALQSEEITQAGKAEMYRLYGDLITANHYNIPSGAKEITLQNYYDPDGASIKITLDSMKTPIQNAQRYYRIYAKAKTTLEKQTLLIEETKEELRYLESMADYLSRSTEELEINEIRSELIREGYIKGAPVKGKMKQPPLSKPHHFISSDGFDIFVGKNNLQNDLLTLKIASSNDLWLHTKVIPGSHVIIKTLGKTIPENTLIEAANLAAYFSKGRYSGNVPVDYCPKKNVKKPGGAKPGMVIYDHYNTIYITPSEEDMRGMKKG